MVDDFIHNNGDFQVFHVCLPDGDSEETSLICCFCLVLTVSGPERPAMDGFMEHDNDDQQLQLVGVATCSTSGHGHKI